MTARVWNVQTGQTLLTLTGHNNWIWSIDFSSDGRRLVTASRDNSVKVWDSNSGTELFTWRDPEAIGDFDAHFSPDGSQILVGRENGSSMILNAFTGDLLLTLTGHTGLTIRNVYSPDGTLIATTNFDGTAKVWDAETGEELLTLVGHANNVVNVDFSPDSSRLLTSSFDGTVRVYTLILDELIALAQSRVTRAITALECQRFVHQEQCRV
jgi:WD40 repeat protein